MPKNHYQILGISKEASADEIKKSYRTLVRRYHPDNTEGKGNKEMFHLIQKAWEILSDETLKKNYDKQFFNKGWESEKFDPFAKNPKSFKQKAKVSIFDNVDSKMKNWKSPDLKKLKKKVPDLSAFKKTEEAPSPSFGKVLGETFGKVKKMTDSGIFTASLQKAKDAISKPNINVQIDTLESIKGTTKKVDLQIEGSPFSTQVTIPTVVDDGEIISISIPQLPEEKFYAKIEITSHDFIERDGLDITINLPISIDEALQGTEIKIPNLGNPDGGKLNIKVSAGHKLGKKLKIKGKGLNSKGDLYVKPYLIMPEIQNSKEFESSCQVIKKLYQKDIRNNFKKIS